MSNDKLGAGTTVVFEGEGYNILNTPSNPNIIINNTPNIIFNTEPKVGKKYDSGKPDLSLVPAEFSALTAKAFMYGAEKYGRYNYLAGMDWHRLIAAAKRHIDAFQEGEDLDQESGLPHLGHAAACIAMLTVYYTRGLGTDTRYKGDPNESK